MSYLLILFWNLAAVIPIWLGWWDVFAVLALYWFENACTGVFQYLRIRDTEGTKPRKEDDFGMASFFAMHYGIFTGVHGLLVLVFFGIVTGGFSQAGQGWWLSALAVFATQAIGYKLVWQKQRGWLHTTSGRLMAEPYARVLILHLIVIAGGLLALRSDAPRTILLTFALIKLPIELLANGLWRRFATKTAAATATGALLLVGAVACGGVGPGAVMEPGGFREGHDQRLPCCFA